MPTYDIYDMDKNSVGTVDIDSEIFEYPIKEHLMHAVVRWQLSKKRLGTASTKTRGEVSGGGKKPWKQKHLGRARQGSIRAPQWRKGGIVFGPKPRDWSFDIPKKIRRQALKSALSLKHRDGSIIIIKELVFPQVKTRRVAEFIKRFGLDKALILTSEVNDTLKTSARNIREVKVLNVQGVNVYDLLRFNSLIVTEKSLLRLQEVYKG